MSLLDLLGATADAAESAEDVPGTHGEEARIALVAHLDSEGLTDDQLEAIEPYAGLVLERARPLARAGTAAASAAAVLGWWLVFAGPLAGAGPVGRLAAAGLLAYLSYRAGRGIYVWWAARRVRAELYADPRSLATDAGEPYAAGLDAWRRATSGGYGYDGWLRKEVRDHSSQCNDG